MYYYSTCILAFLLFILSSCSGEEGNQSQEEAAANDGNVQVIELRSVGDQMQFDKDEIRVSPNQTVRIVLINEATMDAMKHNVLIVNEGTVNEVGQAAMSEVDNDYVPESPDVLFASALAEPGETVEIEFTPPGPGTYEFVCTFPGHYSMMRGTFIVEEE
ncbi:MAG: plastocyanin/azurin family copper-binding protein [Balneolales bacterium]